MPRKRVHPTPVDFGQLVYNCPTTDTGHHTASDIVRVNRSQHEIGLTFECKSCDDYHIMYIPIKRED